MTVNEQLLKAIKARTEKQTEFGYGITTADRYVRSIRQCVGIDACYKFMASKAKAASFHDVLEKASKTLVYSSPEMKLENQMLSDAYGPLAMQGTAEYWYRKSAENEVTIELPKNTLMVFKHVLTTPRKDRDGDILRTEGAEVDPSMILLWQHVHTLPIGKMITVVEHSSSKLTMISAIVDMNELSHDAAVMIDNGMGRFSHGFRALEFEALKEDETETTGGSGFDIKRFEIMEASLVSVPSNVDAEVEEVIVSLVDGGKLTSGLMKSYGRSLKEQRPKSVPVDIAITVNGEPINAKSGAGSEATGTKQGCSCPSKEAEADGTKETNEASHEEVTELKFHGTIEGSWEETECELRREAKAFLQTTDIQVGERDWVYLIATFEDHAIVCVEKPEAGVPDEFRYFKIDWERTPDGARFKGSPEQVEIITTTEVKPKSFKEREAEEKAGRQLSRRNLEVLIEIKADIDELLESENLTRSNKALCERCSTKLAAIIEAASSTEEEASTTPTEKQSVIDSIAQVIAEASPSQRKHLFTVLEAMERVDERNLQTEAVQALL